MFDDVIDLDKRLSVVETEIENTQKTIDKLEGTVSDNYNLTLSIKERLDKQNRMASSFNRRC